LLIYNKINDAIDNRTTSQTLVQTCLYKENGATVNLLEPLIELLLLSRESSLSNVVCTFEDFTKLFDISSAIINEFLHISFIETEMTSAITNLQMSANEKVLVFGSNTRQYSEEKIVAKIEKERTDTQ
jgi:hypothetical protein